MDPCSGPTLWGDLILRDLGEGITQLLTGKAYTLLMVEIIHHINQGYVDTPPCKGGYFLG